eukprot:1917761-Alexandrium_andersonii.AAC.1
MSASLVGSEMCIRDSSFVLAHASSTMPLKCWAHGLRAGCRAHIDKAVSYTHLTLPTICSV